MTYQITITNSYKPEEYRRPYNISPTIRNDVSDGEYLLDSKTLDDGTVQIPLYKRSGYLILPPGGIWTAETDDANEVAYYKSMFLENVKVDVPDEPGPGPEPPGPEPGTDWEEVTRQILCNTIEELEFPDGMTMDDLPTTGAATIDKLTHIKKMTFPSSFGYIASSSFWDREALEEVVLAEGITRIEAEAFSGCSNLKSINLPSTITGLGDMFVAGSAITEITIPASVDYAEYSWFEDCESLAKLILEWNPPIELQMDPFSELVETCVIYVPQGTLAAYTSAEKYPDPSIYTYVEY